MINATDYKALAEQVDEVKAMLSGLLKKLKADSRKLIAESRWLLAES